MSKCYCWDSFVPDTLEGFGELFGKKIKVTVPRGKIALYYVSE
jgi:hypothetical protein